MHWTTGKEQPERILINGKVKLLSDIQAIQKKPRLQLHHQAHRQRFSCSSIGKRQQLQKKIIKGRQTIPRTQNQAINL